MGAVQSKPERRMSGRTFIIILIIGVIVGVALVAGSVYLNAAPSKTASLTGTLTISSGGKLATGGQTGTYVATYNVTLAAISGSGTMNLTLLSNTTDLLQQHEFVVSSFLVSPNNLTMGFGGASVNLAWINNSTVWKEVNASYVGAWGINAPANEMSGEILPNDFPGVPQGYYVLLSLSITSQPTNNIPFVVNPIATRGSSLTILAVVVVPKR